MAPNYHKISNNQKNALNFKIAKCKNWEKEGMCKYGAHCTFAHGNNELRNKKDNRIKMQPGMGMMIQPFMMNMQPIMQMGQMNQLYGMENNVMNPFMFGLGMPANNDLQRQINENMSYNTNTHKWFRCWTSRRTNGKF